MRDMVRAFPQIRLILMSATIDTSLFSDYFETKKIVEVYGRVHPVQYYFLEDIVEMLKFMPTPDSRKRKNNKGRDDDDDDVAALLGQDDEQEENCNKLVSNDYSQNTRMVRIQITEKYCIK